MSGKTKEKIAVRNNSGKTTPAATAPQFLRKSKTLPQLFATGSAMKRARDFLRKSKTTPSNQNTRMTTIKYKKSKRKQSRSYSEFAFDCYNKVGVWATRAVGEIPSSKP
ncbi:hypothetical protein F2Q70_00004516 [Brassica cretica]|uniref:Uncharacterized protein n=1 Tax=Brassica cretica TaxID=69181 RepID=A0A8S9IWS3_BRACR|nr:hypothetical protein F2Q70_00004516 [Brassica cretica]KAF3568086.1 hypothetical protein DY000_02016586 [Brassica cretica]